MAKPWKVISPGKLDLAAMRSEVIRAMTQVQNEVQERFNRTTATWSSEPSWVREVSGPNGLGGVFTAEVLTNDEVYVLVSGGASAHAIYPVNAKKLAFPGTFSAKTTPNRLASSTGFSGGTTQIRDGVEHPGFTARNFDQTVKRLYEPIFKKKIEALLPKMAKASKHYLS